METEPLRYNRDQAQNLLAAETVRRFRALDTKRLRLKGSTATCSNAQRVAHAAAGERQV